MLLSILLKMDLQCIWKINRYHNNNLLTENTMCRYHWLPTWLLHSTHHNTKMISNSEASIPVLCTTLQPIQKILVQGMQIWDFIEHYVELVFWYNRLWCGEGGLDSLHVLSMKMLKWDTIKLLMLLCTVKPLSIIYEGNARKK